MLLLHSLRQPVGNSESSIIESHKVTGPNQVWVSDLTYIPTEKEGFVYLVVVMDVFNREIKGWDLSASMRAENTKNALINAIRSTPGKLNLLIFHTDQGVQNCSSDFHYCHKCRYGFGRRLAGLKHCKPERWFVRPGLNDCPDDHRYRIHWYRW